jgi:hypothetical protein
LPGTSRRVKIKTKHEPPEFRKIRFALGQENIFAFVGHLGGAEDNPRLRCDRAFATGGFNANQWRSGIYLHIRHCHDLPDSAGKWRDYLRFHFHGFEYGQAISHGNQIPGLHGN